VRTCARVPPVGPLAIVTRLGSGQVRGCWRSFRLVKRVGTPGAIRQAGSRVRVRASRSGKVGRDETPAGGGRSVFASMWTASSKPFIAAIGDSARQGEPVGGSPSRPSAQCFDAGSSSRVAGRQKNVIYTYHSRRKNHWPGACIPVPGLIFVKRFPVLAMSAFSLAPKRMLPAEIGVSAQRYCSCARGTETGSGSSLDIALRRNRRGLGRALNPASQSLRMGAWSTATRPLA